MEHTEEKVSATCEFPPLAMFTIFTLVSYGSGFLVELALRFKIWSDNNSGPQPRVRGPVPGLGPLGPDKDRPARKLTSSDVAEMGAARANQSRPLNLDLPVGINRLRQ